MGLTLITGPANAGKVARLLRRYLDVLDREPVLIVPNRSDVDRTERDLLALRPTLLSPDVIEYLDSGKIAATDANGKRLFRMRRGEDAEYWEGE